MTNTLIDSTSPLTLVVSKSHQPRALLPLLPLLPDAIATSLLQAVSLMSLNQFRGLLGVLSVSHSAMQYREAFLKCTLRLDPLLLQSFNGSFFPTDQNPHPLCLAPNPSHQHHLLPLVLCTLCSLNTGQGLPCPKHSSASKAFPPLPGQQVCSSCKSPLFGQPTQHSLPHAPHHPVHPSIAACSSGH